MTRPGTEPRPPEHEAVESILKLPNDDRRYGYVLKLNVHNDIFKPCMYRLPLNSKVKPPLILPLYCIGTCTKPPATVFIEL